MLSFTQVLALEWGEAGVRANVLTPGWVMTDVNRRFLEAERDARLAVDSVPMGRLGKTGDIVGAALWLASDASAYVTGANLAIDGGLALGLSEDWRALRLRDGRDASPD